MSTLLAIGQPLYANLTCEEFFENRLFAKDLKPNDLVQIISDLLKSSSNRTEEAEQIVIDWIEKNPKNEESPWLTSFLLAFEANPRDALLEQRFELSPLVMNISKEMSPIVFKQNSSYQAPKWKLGDRLSSLDEDFRSDVPEHPLSLQLTLGRAEDIFFKENFRDLVADSSIDLDVYKRAITRAGNIRREDTEVALSLIEFTLLNSPSFNLDIENGKFFWLTDWMYRFQKDPFGFDPEEANQTDLVHVLLKELKRPIPANANLNEIGKLTLIRDEKKYSKEVFEELIMPISRHTHIDVDRNFSIQNLVFEYRIAGILQSLVKEDFLDGYQTNHMKLADLIDSTIEKLELFTFGSGSIANHSEHIKALKKAVLAGAKQNDQKLAIEAVFAPKSFKEKLFTSVNMNKYLVNPQSWMSWNSPEVAVRLLEFLEHQNNQMKNQINTFLKQKVGRTVKELSQDRMLLNIHTDSVIDIFALYYKERALNKANPNETLTKLAEILPQEDFVFRYFNRVPVDTNLGKHCGDCTAPGGGNSGNAVTWFYNPTYQIVTLEKAGRFIGRFNLSLVEINKMPSILVDAMEFNPQTSRNPEYSALLTKGIEQAVEKFKQLAKSEKRDLYFLVTSNTGEANAQISRLGKKTADNLLLTIRFPALEVASVLDDNSSNTINLMPYYQTIQRAQRPPNRNDQENIEMPDADDFLNDENRPKFSVQPKSYFQEDADKKQQKQNLEALVFSPANFEVPGFREYIEAAKNETNFAKFNEHIYKAAEVLFVNPQLKSKLKGVLGINAEDGISLHLIVNILKENYGSRFIPDQIRSYDLDSNQLVVF